MKKHLIIASLVAAALAAVLGYFALHIDLIPHPASAERWYIDDFMKILFSIAAIFFAVIITFFIYILVFFRQRPGDLSEGRGIKGYAPLERVWTLVPLVIVLVLAAYAGIVLNKMTSPGAPQTELEVDVIAQRYTWQFNYPAYNLTSYELYAVQNQRLYLRLQSKDVVHSFWVQEWGPKQDVVPGIITEIRFTPNQTGQYLVQCSQLCGAGHTYMTAPARVVSAADFQTWIASQTKTPSSHVPPSSTPPPQATPAAPATLTFNLVAQNMAFSLASIPVTAGADVVINFSNLDSGIPHNFSLYSDSSAKVSFFNGQIVTGPAAVTYRFKAPATPGNYFFRCDVHPTTMTGTLVVK